MCRWKGSWHKSKKRGKESSKLSKVQGFEKLCGFQKSPWLQGDRKGNFSLLLILMLYFP